MDIVNETPSIVNMQKFPQREEEKKKTKKKQSQSKFDYLLFDFEEVPSEENNVITIQDKPERVDTPDKNGLQKKLNFEEGSRHYGPPDKELDSEEDK